MTQKKTPPKISVVMATYNRAHLLPDTVRSIINQTLTDWELIIVDDASSDSTPQILQELAASDSRIRYHRNQHNSGLAVCRNISFELARGTYIALQDDDDMSLPHRLQAQADFLEQNPHIHLVSAWLEYFTDHSPTRKILTTHWTSQPHAPPNTYPPRPPHIMPLPGGCIMGHRHVFKTLEMRPFFHIAEDYDFILRCIEQYGISHVPNVLYRCRLADAQHKTLSTDSEKTFDLWRYHLAAWISAYCRGLSRPDPVEQHTDVSALLRDTAPLFKAIPPAAQKHLLRTLCRRCLHHALRHKDAHRYQQTLDILSKLSDKKHILAIMPKVLFACLRRGRASFIAPFMTTLLDDKQP